MADRADTTSWCPRCMRPTGEAARCPSCGLAQLGADADRLRVVVWRLHEIGERQRALEEEAAPLRLEQVRLLQVLGRDSARRPRGARAQWRPEVVRGVLLWLGSILLALAAVSFAVVAFLNLGDAGRAGLLAGTTLVVAACAAAARRPLPATGEALGGLAMALVLVDWYALRRAGVAAGWSPAAWWALGSAVAAAIAGVAAHWLRVQRLSAAGWRWSPPPPSSRAPCWPASLRSGTWRSSSASVPACSRWPHSGSCSHPRPSRTRPAPPVRRRRSPPWRWRPRWLGSGATCRVAGSRWMGWR